MSEAYKELETIAGELGLSCEYEYRPHEYPEGTKSHDMQRRWRVTVLRNGKPVAASDYGEGIAYCEAYPKGAAFGRGLTVKEYDAIRRECESGPRAKAPAQPLQALHCLAMDCVGVDNASGFEDWASEYGHDPDSRKAFAVWEEYNRIYHALRSAIGMDNVRRIADVQL